MQQNDQRAIAGLDVVQPDVADLGVALPKFDPLIRRQRVIGQQILDEAVRRVHDASAPSLVEVCSVALMASSWSVVAGESSRDLECLASGRPPVGALVARAHAWLRTF